MSTTSDASKKQPPATSADVAQWRETTYTRAVAKQGEREAKFTTSSGIVVEPLYTTRNLKGWNPPEWFGAAPAGAETFRPYTDLGLYCRASSEWATSQ